MKKTKNVIAEVSDMDEVEYALMPTISMPDLKCSYFLGKTEGEDAKIMVKVEEGRLKNIVVSLQNFKMGEDSMLTFDYQIEYNPYKNIPGVKALETFLKKCVEKIISDSVKTIIDGEKQKEDDEDRDADPKESGKK